MDSFRNFSLMSSIETWARSSNLKPKLFSLISCNSVTLSRMRANTNPQERRDKFKFYFFVRQKSNKKSRPSTRRDFQNVSGFYSTLINGFRNEAVLRLEYSLLVGDNKITL